MLLSDIFDYLVHGELSQLAIAEKGVIHVNDYPKIIVNLNLAMIELYKRFPIRTRTITIELYTAITSYHLHSDFAASNGVSVEDPKYIADADVDEAFNDDILLITDVFDTDAEALPLNDAESDGSVFTPSPVLLSVPDAADNEILTINYRAKPTKIALITTESLDTIEVEIYPQFLEAITSYIAWKLFSPVNVGDKGEANSYYAKFEAACALIDNLGVLNRDNTRSTRFEDNNWV